MMRGKNLHLTACLTAKNRMLVIGRSGMKIQYLICFAIYLTPINSVHYFVHHNSRYLHKHHNNYGCKYYGMQNNFQDYFWNAALVGLGACKFMK